MGLYKVEVDRLDGDVLVINCGSDLEQAKAIANKYNSYGYDVYIKEIKTVFIRRTVNVYE